jgi:hypothetical protein
MGGVWAFAPLNFMTGDRMHAGRGERIRTSGLYVPNVALYQAKLHPDCGSIGTADREGRQFYQSFMVI